MKRLLAAIRFLTVLPVPGQAGTAETDLAGSVPFFPAVGLLLGGLAAAVAAGLGLLAAPTMVAAAILVIVLLAFSGGLHMDGLSDSADGFLSARPRERVLEIMKDSHVGAMGVMAVVCVLLLKFAALASLPRHGLWLAGLLVPLAGRCAMVTHMALLPYVREGGIASIFRKESARPAAVVSAAVLAAAAALGGAAAGATAGRMRAVMATGLAALLAGVVSIFAAVGWSAWCRRKIGGATGDTYGAACEIGEATFATLLAMLIGI